MLHRPLSQRHHVWYPLSQSWVILGAYSGIEEIKKAIPYLVKSIELLLPHTDALDLLCWPIVVGTSTAALVEIASLMRSQNASTFL
jgi:hypothetical protein